MTIGIIQRRALLIGVILMLCYWFTRTFNLLSIPIFTDEAIYIRWSQIGTRDPNWRFISLTDGKQPMFTWIAMILLRLIPDPLLAGRFVSIISGFFTLVGIYFLSYELFHKHRLSFISGLLYIFSPFALMYDRLALYDSLVATFSIWSLYLAILLVRYIRLDISLILGIVMGLGVLNKSSGFLSVYMLPTTLLLFDWHKLKRESRLMWWAGYIVLAAAISMGIYSILRLSPYFYMISQKDSVFVFPMQEWFTRPLSDVFGNFKGLTDWLFTYLTKPIILLSIFPIFLIRSKFFEKLLLYVWWLFPFVALALFAKVLYPRFILFMTMPLLILATYSFDWLIENIGKTLFGVGMICLLFFPSFRASYYIFTNPLYAPIPITDRGQLLDDWPSGWGVREVSNYLLDESQKGHISVYTEGTFGLLPYALEIYLVDKPGISIHGLWPVKDAIPQQMINDASILPTFLILNESQSPPKGWPLDQISEYTKGRNPDSKLRLYKVIQQNNVDV